MIAHVTGRWAIELDRRDLTRQIVLACSYLDALADDSPTPHYATSILAFAGGEVRTTAHATPEGVKIEQRILALQPQTVVQSTKATEESADAREPDRETGTRPGDDLLAEWGGRDAFFCSRGSQGRKRREGY